MLSNNLDLRLFYGGAGEKLGLACQQFVRRNISVDRHGIALAELAFEAPVTWPLVAVCGDSAKQHRSRTSNSRNGIDADDFTIVTRLLWRHRVHFVNEYFWRICCKSTDAGLVA